MHIGKRIVSAQGENHVFTNSSSEHSIPSTKPGLFMDRISMVNNLSMIQGLFVDGISMVKSCFDGGLWIENVFVLYADLFGSREFKYGFISENTLESVQWNIVDIKAPQYFFVPKDFSMKEEYDRGFSISELMPLYKAGVATGKDDVLVNISSDELLKKCQTFFSIVPQPSTVKTYSYRPFDTRYIYFDTTLVQRPRFALMKHLEHPNIALIVTSQNRQLSTSYFRDCREMSKIS